ncbi:hypothetical protein IC762_12175 [Bradyrhizobium genosp. L]|uniref:hypothetical protein n=1 Tax=Bradyrhizobium genosp. L TaxID=83637 RepID=UPI0018A30A51|nr:hypothetical protein [Bradyrhizobium genosp. L]QPF87001.1 hypothetical protein IC762_12175 [Bradyrhizobium genosp. L]
MTPSRDPIIVTDHAVLRYMERAMDLNVEVVRQHILAVCANAAAFGAVCVRAEGLRFEINGNRICTVTPDHTEPSKTGQARAIRRAQG